MSKRFKRRCSIIISCILISLLLLLMLFFYRNGIFSVYMKLKGNQEIQLEIGKDYEELGVIIRNDFQDLSSQVLIESNLNVHLLGEYEIDYKYGNHQLTRIIHIVDTLAPKINLIGEKEQILFQGENYQELGVEVYDNSKEDLSDQIKITHSIDSNIPGNYEVLYSVKDTSGNEAMIQRFVEVVENPSTQKLFYHYDNIDNTSQNWWFHKAKDHLRKPASFDEKKLKQYKAYHLGNDEKVIYLTFDEGGNDVTYIKEIIDILNRQSVQATFFLTRNYIAHEADLMRDLIKNGHVIGNHTRNHYKMSEWANAQGIETFVSEIMDTEKTIYEITQQKPARIFRFPSGEYSERALAIVHDLDYKTYFWSHAYMDYGADVSKEEAYNNLISHIHPGAIYLLHPSNSGNYEAMDSFIEECIAQGYRFDIVSNIE